MVFDPCWLLLKLFLIKTKEAFKNIGVQSDIYSNTFNAFLASMDSVHNSLNSNAI